MKNQHKKLRQKKMPTAYAVLGLLCASTAALGADPYPTPACNGSRVPPAQRRFNSSVVEALIASYKPRFSEPNISKLFENALPNCLDTTVTRADAAARDTFVITGDIDAMWLRDSTNQLLPYVPLAARDEELAGLVCGAVRRQAALVLTNRYANAFNPEPSSAGHKDDAVATKPKVPYCDGGAVFENKYELDSLVNVLKLANEYWNATADLSCFREEKAPPPPPHANANASNSTWLSAVAAILDTIAVQQAGTDEDFDDPSYTFQRTTNVATDTLLNAGRGVPARRTGMSKSYFRPSDDATTLPFFVPANAYAVVELRQLSAAGGVLAALAAGAGGGSEPGVAAVLSKQAAALGAEIDAGIKEHAIVIPAAAAGAAASSAPSSPHYAYEVDGFGSYYFMDDANVPSLLALPYLGYVAKDDPIYLATRKRVLSNLTNPWFFAGSAGEGVGGPHQGTNMVWPMSIIMRALTSDDDDEISECLALLARTHDDTFFIHESFNRNDASKFTRRWFSWANSLFGTLIITLARERPHLIFKE